MSDLTKKQAKLKQLQSSLKDRKEGKKSKKASFEKKYQKSYDKSKAKYDLLKKKSTKSLKDGDKEFLKDYEQIKKFDQIIRTYNEKIAKLKKEIAELKKNGAKASSTKTHPIKVARCKTTKCQPKKKDELPTKPTICITLDHLNQDKSKWRLTSLDIASRLRSKGIPVTVFVSCTGPKDDGKHLLNSCTKNEIDMMKKLHNLGVTLGIHTLETFSTNGKIPTKANQTANIEHLRNTIKKVTGKYPRVASYHGSEAGPHPNIHLRSTKKSKDIQYVRGVSPTDGGRYNTPVLPNYNNSLKNLKGITTFFFHSNELKVIPILATDSKAEKAKKAKQNTNIKNIIVFFKKLINSKKYHFVNYYDAMKTRYK